MSAEGEDKVSRVLKFHKGAKETLDHLREKKHRFVKELKLVADLLDREYMVPAGVMGGSDRGLRVDAPAAAGIAEILYPSREEIETLVSQLNNAKEEFERAAQERRDLGID